MKTLDADQEILLRQGSPQLIDLVVIRVYTDREADTLDTEYRFSTGTFYYDWQNTGTDREFEAHLISIDRQGDLAGHLPTEPGSLIRSRTIRLRNGDRGASGEKLWKTLRGKNLEFADVEIAHIAVEGTDPQRFTDLSALTGDEHTTTFRGVIVRVARVSESEIVLECESALPNVPWIIASDAAKNDPLDLGKRLPVVYGQAKRVPCIGWEVGALTTLAFEIPEAEVDQVQLSDSSAFPSSGSFKVGQEEIAYTGKDGTDPNLLTGVTRGDNGTEAVLHSAGEACVELITTVTFIVAGHECDALQALWVLNIFNGLPFRVAAAYPFTTDLVDVTTVSGETVTSVKFTKAQLIALQDAAWQDAKVNVQPGISHPSSVAEEQQAPNGGTLHPNGRDADNGTVVWYTSDSDEFFPLEATVQFGGGAGKTVTFPDPGTIVSQTIRIHITGATRKNNSSNRLRIKLGAVEIGDIGFTAGTFTFASTETGDVVTLVVDTADSDDIAWAIDYVDRDYSLTDPAPSLSTEAKVVGANLGYGLRFFADVDGFPFDLVLYNMDSDVANWSPNFCTLADENTIKQEGTGSLKVTANSSTDDESFRTRVSENWQNKLLSVWIYIPSISGVSLVTVSGIAIRLASDTGPTNWSQWSFGTDDGLAEDDAWHQITLDISNDTPNDTGGTGLDDTDVQYIGILGTIVVSGEIFYYDLIELAGGVFEKPTEIVRHFIAEYCGLGQDAIDEPALATAATNLGSNVHAPIVNALGDDFEEILQRMAVEFRSNVIPVEGATVTQWRMIAAESDHEWPVSLRTLTRWGSVVEQGANADANVTRFLYPYAWDPSLGTDIEAFASAVRIDADQDDVADPSITQLQNAEKAFGRRDGEAFALIASQALATAKNVAAYYAHEGIRVMRILDVPGVPLQDSIDLEPLDIVELVNPLTGDTFKARIIGISRAGAMAASLILIGVD